MTKLVLMLLVSMQAMALPLHGVGCAATAELAVARILGQNVPANLRDGFRVEAVRIDAVRGRRWAMVASCAEPGRPRTAVMLPGLNTLDAAGVNAGDNVVVWSGNADSSMELSGAAMQAGSVGQRIHVRLSTGWRANEHATTDVECDVVSAGVVEVVR